MGILRDDEDDDSKFEVTDDGKLKENEDAEQDFSLEFDGE